MPDAATGVECKRLRGPDAIGPDCGCHDGACALGVTCEWCEGNTPLRVVTDGIETTALCESCIELLSDDGVGANG